MVSGKQKLNREIQSEILFKVAQKAKQNYQDFYGNQDIVSAEKFLSEIESA